MANRFTDTGKWADNDFSGLSLNAKIVYLYILDNCNNAGFYEPNIRLMEFQIGMKSEDIHSSFAELNKKCIQKDGWIWVKAFLKRQGNFLLKESNNAHKQIIGFIKDQLKRYSSSPEFVEFFNEFTEDVREILGAKEGLISPPVMYSNVMSSPEPSSSLKGGVGENFLSATEIIPPVVSMPYIELKNQFRELIGRDKLTSMDERSFSSLYTMFTEEKIRDAIQVCSEEGWRSFASLKDYLLGKLKRKSERNYGAKPRGDDAIKAELATGDYYERQREKYAKK